MQEFKTASPSQPRREGDEHLDFVLMPRLPDTPQTSKNNILPPGQDNESPKRRFLYLGIIVAALVVLAAFFVWLRRPGQTSQPNEEPKDISIEVPAKTEEADSDGDGLLDETERELATNPQKTDSDGDGLADGDEINIYKSDPLLSDTDNDTFGDGREVARGYSPLVNTADKATSSELQAWTGRIEEFGLHEPTKSTLKLKAESPVNASPAIYTNPVQRYSVTVPSLLTSREKDNGREVGFYVAGTIPDDTDVAADPVSIALAVKVQNQTLPEWVKSQYQPDSYESLEDTATSTLATAKIKGLKNPDCPQNKTFFSKDNVIIIVTLTCNQISEISGLYDEIVQSFKFE